MSDPANKNISGESAPNLDRLERWMFASITHPDGLEAGLESSEANEQFPVNPDSVDQVITRSKSLSSLERLGIYANQYLWRLVDVLAEEFPTVRHALGGEIFYDLVVAYLKVHPSEHYSLSRLGARFPRFIAKEAKEIPHRDFLAEVATLERSMEDVFDAPRSEVISIDDILAVPQERWGEVRFRAIPALELLAFAYPVNDYVQALRDNRAMSIPSPQDSWVVIYRKDYIVWRAGIDLARYTLLGELSAGKPLGEAIEACAAIEGIDLGEIAGSLKDWFQTWSGMGFFSAVEVAED